MNRTVTAAAVLLFALPSLAGSPQGKTAPLPPAKKDASTQTFHGKPQAPVSVTARLAPGHATVTVRFLSAARDAAVEVRGVDGLTVTSASSLLAGARFGRGESVTFDVELTEPAGRSNLAVTVSATFGGSKRSTVATFAVGQPTAEQLKPSGNVTTDSAGQRIKVMPAERR
jgi:hypothetical protein